MHSLSYGLNLSKKADTSSHRPLPDKRSTVFDDSGSDEDSDAAEPQEIQSIGGIGISKDVRPLPSRDEAISSPTSQRKSTSSANFTNLASSHASKKHAQSAQHEDPNVYAYDTVYESLHAQPKKKSQVTGPRYMQGLLDAAEVRKRDQLQAKDKMLAKEREAEGEQYAGKEKFVTSAYRTQQEEVKRLAEEEKKREEEAAKRRRNAGGGMTGWYKGVLERTEDRHAAITEALSKGTEQLETSTQEGHQEEESAPFTRVGTTLNDDGQVVDKRELLTAGLNVKQKSKATPSDTHATQGNQQLKSMALSSNLSRKSGMRERQTRMLEAQLEQSAKRAAENEQVEQESFQRAAKSSKTKQDVSSAKERYLQRKRDAEAARQERAQ